MLTQAALIDRDVTEIRSHINTMIKHQSSLKPSLSYLYYFANNV